MNSFSNYVPYKRLNLHTCSDPGLVSEFVRVTKLQVAWRLTHDGREHVEHYDYLIRIREELVRRNITPKLNGVSES